MIPTWPADLPQRVLQDGYSEPLADGRLGTSMETGPQKVRRRFSAAARPVSAQFRVTLDQKARLARFWEEETGGGALPFWFPDPVADGAALAMDDGSPLLTEDGSLILIESWWLVMFSTQQPPTFSTRDRGLSFIASAPLVIMP